MQVVVVAQALLVQMQLLGAGATGVAEFILILLELLFLEQVAVEVVGIREKPMELQLRVVAMPQ
jgi:hypothetical protein